MLGGIVLYVLYEFREPVLKFLVWGTILVGGTWLAGVVILGGWRFAHHPSLMYPISKRTLPEGAFSWAVLILGPALVGGVIEEIRKLKGRRNKTTKRELCL